MDADIEERERKQSRGKKRVKERYTVRGSVIMTVLSEHRMDLSGAGEIFFFLIIVPIRRIVLNDMYILSSSCSLARNQ